MPKHSEFLIFRHYLCINLSEFNADWTPKISFLVVSSSWTLGSSLFLLFVLSLSSSLSLSFPPSSSSFSSFLCMSLSHSISFFVSVCLSLVSLSLSPPVTHICIHLNTYVDWYILLFICVLKALHTSFHTIHWNETFVWIHIYLLVMYKCSRMKYKRVSILKYPKLIKMVIS